MTTFAHFCGFRRVYVEDLGMTNSETGVQKVTFRSKSDKSDHNLDGLRPRRPTFRNLMTGRQRYYISEPSGD